VGHARDPNELFEFLGNELRAVIRDDPGPCLRILLLGCLSDDLDVRLDHRLPQIPVDDVSATAVQNAAQVIEGPADVQPSGDIIPGPGIWSFRENHRLETESRAKCPAVERMRGRTLSAENLLDHIDGIEEGTG
jgi:hypothetical protein